MTNWVAEFGSERVALDLFSKQILNWFGCLLTILIVFWHTRIQDTIQTGALPKLFELSRPRLSTEWWDQSNYVVWKESQVLVVQLHCWWSASKELRAQAVGSNNSCGWSQSSSGPTMCSKFFRAFRKRSMCWIFWSTQNSFKSMNLLKKFISEPRTIRSMFE